MRIQTALVGVAFGIGLVLGSTTAPASDGEDLNVINKTGHVVDVFLLQEASADLDPEDGVQFARLKDGESGIAHVPHCEFEILLVDHEDVWHAEFHDCHSTEMTFTVDTGHAKRAHHHGH